MGQCRKIDESLKDRYKILQLLEKIKQDDITVAEMEETGTELCKSGKRALSLLLRRLWREKSCELIYRYTYLLDFFEDDNWVDQLIQVALKRRDLGDDGKAAILAVLEERGVDVSIPPLANLLASAGTSLHQTLPRLLDRGDDGLVSLMEDFFFFSREAQLEFIREIPCFSDPRVISVLEVLLGIDDLQIRGETVTALGRMRTGESVILLQKIAEKDYGPIRELALQSLRRLSFAGVDTTTPTIPSDPENFPPFYASYAGPINACGFRTVWIARNSAQGLVKPLYLQMHEKDGLSAVWGCNGVSIEEFATYLAENSAMDDIAKVSAEYALSLIRNAVYLNRENSTWLPAEFYVRRRIFADEEIAPAKYSPSFRGYDLDELAASTRHIFGSASLLDDDCFSSWILTSSRVWDYGEEWLNLLKNSNRQFQAKGLDAILERFCEELLVPEIEVVCRRLLMTADFMRRTGKERELVEIAIAAALSLPMSRFRGRHPFFKRLALESMEVAKEALEKGYDLRIHEDHEEDW